MMADNLQNAIVLQAVSDYRRILDGELIETKDCNRVELERFFRSKYFTILSNLDGVGIMKRIKAEYAVPARKVDPDDLRRKVYKWIADNISGYRVGKTGDAKYGRISGGVAYIRTEAFYSLCRSLDIGRAFVLKTLAENGYINVNNGRYTKCGKYSFFHDMNTSNERPVQCVAFLLSDKERAELVREIKMTANNYRRYA